MPTTKPTLRRMLQMAALIPLLALPGLALAQVPKDKGPLKLVVGFPAGGSADVAARQLADRLKDELGMPVIVENRAGAGGQIAAEYVKAQAGDGLTVMLGTHHMMVVLPMVVASAKYDPVKDFKSIGRLATFRECLAVPMSSPANTVAQWLELAKTDTKAASYGVPAPGSLPQFMGYLIGQTVGVKVVPVPYRGAAPVTQDLLGAQLGAGVIPVADLIQYHGNKVKILAVNGSQRTPLLPQVPTFKELGVPQFDDLEWVGLFLPASASAATVAQLEAAMQKVSGAKELRESFGGIGMEVDFSPGATMGARIQAEAAKWAPVVKSSGFVAQ